MALKINHLATLQFKVIAAQSDLKIIDIRSQEFDGEIFLPTYLYG
jgi:hypothetical protein